MNDIVKICIHHGELVKDQVYFVKGKPKQCKQCCKSYFLKNRDHINNRISSYIKKDRKINPEKYANAQRKYHKKYRKIITDKTIIRGINITLEQYQQMFIDQNHKCYICKKEETKINFNSKRVARLSLDHCHKTNNPRRLLCHNCNIMIGSSKESIETLQEAINYLKEFTYDKPRK